ncbi:MAG: glutamate--tRNA ligase, partial [Campylobacter ureolyticus]|nr:glutamate--tRNA ligase [Campylobacter ureolyticus]
LGWSHGDDEIFSMKELKELFDPHNLSKSSSSFNQSKLEWLNQHYIKNASFERLSHELKEFDLNLDDVKHAKLLIDSIKERSVTLLQMKEMANSILNKPQSYNEKAYKKFINENSLKLLASFSEILDKDMDALEYEELTNKFLEKNEAKLKDLAQPLRIAITGNSVSPSIFEVLEILGSDEVKQRIKNLINKSKEL